MSLPSNQEPRRSRLSLSDTLKIITSDYLLESRTSELRNSEISQEIADYWFYSFTHSRRPLPAVARTSRSIETGRAGGRLGAEVLALGR